MAQLINKSGLVAEIEKIKNSISSDSFLSEYEKGCNQGKEDVCDALLSFLGTSESKDMNYKENMNYKEKYENALERAKEWHNAPISDRILTYANRVIEEIFPELKESEDEKIRKTLIDFVEQYGDNYYGQIAKASAISWLEKQAELQPYAGNADTMRKNLIKAFKSVGGNHWGGFDVRDIIHFLESKDAIELEKQGEQKPADKIEPKFKVGDWVIRGNITAQILDIQKQYYVGVDTNDNDFTSSRFLSDDKIHLWTIQDAKDGDVLCDYHKEYDNPLIFILKKFEHINFGLVTPSDYSSYCYLTAGDLQRFEEGTYHHKTNIKPATKEQRDMLFQKMKEAGYEWDVDKKELKKIEQNPAWSEEDEDMVDNIFKAIQHLLKENDSWGFLEDCLDWLKSLKNRVQPHWKPTEEQMSCFKQAIDLFKMKVNDDVVQRYLNSLYNDLKKL